MVGAAAQKARRRRWEQRRAVEQLPLFVTGLSGSAGERNSACVFSYSFPDNPIFFCSLKMSNSLIVFPLPTGASLFIHLLHGVDYFLLDNISITMQALPFAFRLPISQLSTVRLDTPTFSARPFCVKPSLARNFFISSASYRFIVTSYILVTPLGQSIVPHSLSISRRNASISELIRPHSNSSLLYTTLP